MPHSYECFPRDCVLRVRSLVFFSRLLRHPQLNNLRRRSARGKYYAMFASDFGHSYTSARRPKPLVAETGRRSQPNSTFHERYKRPAGFALIPHAHRWLSSSPSLAPYFSASSSTPLLATVHANSPEFGVNGEALIPPNARNGSVQSMCASHHFTSLSTKLTGNF